MFNATIEGPFYESWPPKRQIALLGEDPNVENAVAILRPIAERAWRRSVGDGELDSILQLVRSRAETVSDIEALKEGIVAILASPSFLILNPGNGAPADRFATKLSYFLKSTIPDERTRAAARNGALATFRSVRAEVQRQFDQSAADEFLREFPHAWLELDRINFMAPDPDHFPLYDRKRLSDDMINEALRFFSHIVANNLPVPEFLSADYSFLNADLARVYGVDDVPQDSKLRKYTFADGRRGGLLGMGAFLTLTADTLSTSPIPSGCLRDGEVHGDCIPLHRRPTSTSRSRMSAKPRQSRKSSRRTRLTRRVRLATRASTPGDTLSRASIRSVPGGTNTRRISPGSPPGSNLRRLRI